MVKFDPVFKPQILVKEFDVKSILISQMNMVREILKNTVGKFNRVALDAKVSKDINSIGSILSHIAALEYRYQVLTFDEREFNMLEEIKWHGALADELHLEIIKDNDLQFYLELLESTRARTLKELSMVDDKWLFSAPSHDFGAPINNYYCWFHVLEHEISHLGQIKMISTLLKKAYKSISL